jgi:hypothetical protein
MLKDLSPGLKTSITRSISLSFEQYMNKINWSEDQFDIEAFMGEWKSYLHKSASWYDKVSDEIKASPLFHEELVVKINETINKILAEKPKPEQMEEIEELQMKVNKEYNYSCRAEARYVLEKLREELKRNKN